MVKLRGINIYPQAFASLLAPLPGFTGEYLCVLATRDGQDVLTVRVECSQPSSAALVDQYQSLLKERLGVHIEVSLTAPESLTRLTGVDSRQKPIRLIDERQTNG